MIETVVSGGRQAITVHTAEHFLVEGESFIDDYNVEIARWSNSHWSSTIPPLYAILTNFRIILQPHTRKHYDPAIIPTSYVYNVTELNAGRHGIMLHLRTGHRIGMFVSGDPRRDFMANLRRLRGSKPNFKIDGDFNINTIQRLIDFLAVP